MKSLSRILTVCLCCVPSFGANAAPVATTAGSNLTAYNPNNAYNNQWATISNGRYDGNTTAKVDFGNCNAVVLRCAQPKCNNGGCADASVASAIVAGCVRSNNQCKQYGDDLVEYMTAQLVASSTAKMNQQQAAIAQAQAAAEAQAAAAQNEQIEQMQNQMYQMQQQMAQQQAESAAALQEALAQQAAQSAAALEDMRSAATDAAKQTEAGITAYQQDAINRGISEEVLARQQITGQIQTEIEDAETSMVAMKKAMQNAFDYAGCDARGNNCTGPRRIKKWRELAIGFLTPYDTTIDKIYDALVTAQTVGVDLTDIYMMLNNSCNSWGQYMCQSGANIYYISDSAGKMGSPMSCPKTDTLSQRNIDKCYGKNTNDASAQIQCYQKYGCRPCTLLKVLNDKEEVYEGWINPTADSTSNGTVVSCASSILDNTKLFSRRTKNKNGAGLVDIDLLDRWLNQTEPNKVKDDSGQPKPKDYCGVTKDSVAENTLSSATLSHIVNTNDTIKGNNKKFCVNWENGSWQSSKNSDECPYINPTFAICDTHPYNAGKGADWAQDTKFNTDDQESMNRIIGLKITVVSQQMYKQYEYLNATLRRLKTQLQKAVLTSNLEAAGAKSEGSSASGGLVGGKGDEDKTIYLPGANNCSNFMDYDSAYNCLQTNVSLIKTNVNSNTKKACQQLQATVSSAKSILSDDSFGITKTTHACYDFKDVTAESKSCVVGNNKTKIVECANAVNFAVMNEKRNQENRKQKMNTYP